MWLGWMVLGPLAAGALARLAPGEAARRAVLVLAAAANLGAALALWLVPDAARGGDFLRCDALAVLFLLVTGAVFLVTALYAAAGPGQAAGSPPGPAARRWMASMLLLSLGAMNLVVLSQHFGLLWVGVEATTLATAPLIYHSGTPRSLEATWRYLLLCSVGIALALLGTFALGLASGPSGASIRSLQMGDLMGRAARLDPKWLKVSFVLLLVGYGTKMGLAPFHTWLPDAHGEAPAPVSALLSGALLNCAFVAVLRDYQLCSAAGLGAFAAQLLLVLGLFSLAVGAVFVVGQADYKRMLAFSSVEHMGILATGVGLGGVGLYGSLFHALNHSLAKSMLFLTSGNILAVYRTRRAQDVRGLLSVSPLQGTLFVCGYLAVSGVPPFGSFFSEFMILQSGLVPGRTVVGVAYLVLLVTTAVGMAAVVLPMVHGRHEGQAGPEGGPTRRYAPALLGAAALLLGVWMPSPLQRLLADAARSLAR